MTDLWFSPGTLVSSTNKTDCHDITEILLKVGLTTINQPNQPKHIIMYSVITWRKSPIHCPDNQSLLVLLKVTCLAEKWQILNTESFTVVYLTTTTKRSSWLSDYCCLRPNEIFFSYIMARKNYIQWDDDVRFVREQPCLVGFL